MLSAPRAESKKGNRFLPQLATWVDKLTPAGVANSLAQTVLPLTVPGVPDLYQGTKFWDFSLVDPDNRRPVDYAAREQALKDAPAFVTTLDGWQYGRIKQQAIRNLQALRTAEPHLLFRGDYLPLQIEGAMAEYAIAFLQRYENRAMLAVASRLAGTLLSPQSPPRHCAGRVEGNPCRAARRCRHPLDRRDHRPAGGSDDGAPATG